MSMDAKERAALIREGNEAFNDKDIRKAREIFLKTEYKDGLIRLGDYFMYEKRLPILAFGYYKKAGESRKVEEIFQRMLMALSEWIGKDKFIVKPVTDTDRPPVNPDDFVVHPILRQKAMEILRKNSSG